MAGLALGAAALAFGTELINLESALAIIARAAAKMVAGAAKIDADALAEMVELAQGRAPVDTGELLAGIEGVREDAVSVFRAAAINSDDGVDYAPFVEFGTRPGVRGRSVSYASNVGAGGGLATATSVAQVQRTRRQYRGHPGTDPQPFFWPSVRDALTKRELDARRVIADAERDQTA